MFRRFSSIALKLWIRKNESEFIPAWMLELYIDVK